jgi:hypothetical protein
VKIRSFKELTRMTTSGERLKRGAAAIGVTVLIGMAALAVAGAGFNTIRGPLPLNGAGATMTQTTPPPTLATASFSPTVTAPAWAGQGGRPH